MCLFVVHPPMALRSQWCRQMHYQQTHSIPCIHYSPPLTGPAWSARFSDWMTTVTCAFSTCTISCTCKRYVGIRWQCQQVRPYMTDEFTMSGLLADLATMSNLAQMLLLTSQAHCPKLGCTCTVPTLLNRWMTVYMWSVSMVRDHHCVCVRMGE